MNTTAQIETQLPQSKPVPENRQTDIEGQLILSRKQVTDLVEKLVELQLESHDDQEKLYAPDPVNSELLDIVLKLAGTLPERRLHNVYAYYFIVTKYGDIRGYADYLIGQSALPPGTSNFSYLAKAISRARESAADFEINIEAPEVFKLGLRYLRSSEFREYLQKNNCHSF